MRAPKPSEIDPNKSDRYSAGIHRYIRRKRDFGTKVFDTRMGLVIGSVDPFGLMGVRMIDAIHDGGRARLMDFGSSGFAAVPDFWDRYVQVGWCAIDTAHLDHSERWLCTGNIRKCRWCGLEQRRVVESVTTERERWETR